MSRIIAISLLAACMLLGSSLITPYQATAAEKPSLSVAIKKAIDTKGVAAATKQFTEEYAADKDRYQVNIPDLVALVKSYAAEGNSPASNAVLVMANPYMSDATMAARNAKAKIDAKQHSELSNKIKAKQKVLANGAIAEHKKAMADHKSADEKRVAQYEAQRKPVFFKPGASPIKPTPEDKWYIVRTLNVDAKGVSIMSFTEDLHEAAIAAGFKGEKSGSISSYTKGPIRLLAYFDPARNLIKKVRYELGNLTTSQWDAYAKNIMHQLGRAGPECMHRSGSAARLKCSFSYNAHNYYAMVEIKGTLLKDKGRLNLVFQQGP